ncbi:MAG: response regulator transcription factor [Bacilli bacterium]|nr:response regulator transcription factor [Bacilli bacterium]
MAVLLIVEDDMNIHQMMKEYLEKQEDECISAFSGTEALLQLKMNSVDLVILDLMLPGMNGEDVIEKIKQLNEQLPVIVVSAKSNLSDKVDLLNKGADDYLCKPFALEELYARIQVQLRKSTIKNVKELTFKNIKLLYDQKTLMINDTPITLTKHEYKIMELLMLHPKQGFTKKEIYEYAWEDFYAADDKTINVHISNIRNKCSSIQEDIIETIWGIGFKMKS